MKSAFFKQKMFFKLPFESAVIDTTGGQPKLQKREYLSEGAYPVIDQSQEPIAGYTDDSQMLYQGSLPVILFGDHTRIFKYVDFPFVLGADGVKVLTSRDYYNTKFIYFYFQSNSIPSRGYSRHFKFLKEITIPFFVPSEQRRIVEILDQADALRKMRAEADAKSDRILPALFIKMFGDPSTWADANTETLGSLVNIQSGGTPSKKNPDYWDGDIPWVSPKDMKQDIIFDSIDHISQTAIEETNIKYVEPGAILIVVRGMILAHTIPIALAATRLTINQDMKALYPNCSDIDSTYLHAALKASSRKILSQVGTAGHGTRKFDTDELLNLPILIPSQEQLKKFHIAVTECRVSLAGIRKTKEKLETLFNVLLQRAFSGELTAKWREAHIKELLAEMEEQAKVLKSKTDNNYQQLTL
jgi:type I restriction enzyme S subunit